MSMFHSTVSRRKFMKALGFGGAGIGVASMVNPVFHDLDELLSASAGQGKRPWWVKEVSEPTIEIDYSMMERHDSTLQGQSAYMRSYYLGEQRVLEGSAVGAAFEEQKRASGEPGWDVRYQALQQAYARVRPSPSPEWSEMANPTPVDSPEERGEPKWTGTPEEGIMMLRTAMRLYGAELIYPFMMTQEEKDHVIFKNSDKANGNNYINAWPPPDTAARPIVFEDTPDKKPYSTNSKLVVPNNVQLYEVSLSMGGSNEAWRMAPTPVASFANSNTFNNTYTCHASTFNFLRYLGYYQIGIIGNDSTYLGSEGGAAILSGLGEASRQQLYTLTPEKGAPGRLYTIATDMPLAPSGPIDAGLFRFCHSCHKCADYCPPGAISQAKEPTFERDAASAGDRDAPSGYTGKEARWTVKGTKAFVQDGPLCRQYGIETGRCLRCWGECTFTTNRGSQVHQVIRTVISNFSLLNGPAYRLGDLFGYGAWPRTDPSKVEKFFEYELPVLGHDSTICAHDGGYNKWEGPPFL